MRLVCAAFCQWRFHIGGSSVLTYQEAATCVISGLSMGYGYWPVEKGYIGGLVKPATKISDVVVPFFFEDPLSCDRYRYWKIVVTLILQKY